MTDQGPVSQRVAINRTMDIHRSSMANCVQLCDYSQPFLKRGPGKYDRMMIFFFYSFREVLCMLCTQKVAHNNSI